jgi:hypothetical protein
MTEIGIGGSGLPIAGLQILRHIGIPILGVIGIGVIRVGLVVVVVVRFVLRLEFRLSILRLPVTGLRVPGFGIARLRGTRRVARMARRRDQRLVERLGRIACALGVTA